MQRFFGFELPQLFFGDRRSVKDGLPEGLPPVDERAAFNEIEFFKACKDGDTRALANLFADNVNPFAIDESCTHGLRYALDRSDSKACKALIDYSEMYHKMHQMMVPSLVNTPMMNRFNVQRSPLSIAINSSHFGCRAEQTRECVHLLLQAGARAHERRGSGPALLDAISTTPQLCEMLISHGADVNYVAQIDAGLGRTPLMWAVMKKVAGVSSVLLENGANANVVDNEGTTALMIAAEYNNADAVIPLLTHGANIDAADKFGQTPLILAAQKVSIEVVKLLLHHGASLEPVDGFGRNAQDHAKLIYMKKIGTRAGTEDLVTIFRSLENGRKNKS